MQFLKQLVASNGISLVDFKEQAKIKGKLHQAYLTELNEVLYEIFDQVLVISQQQVIVEEDFMEETGNGYMAESKLRKKDAS